MFWAQILAEWDKRAEVEGDKGVGAGMVTDYGAGAREVDGRPALRGGGVRGWSRGWSLNRGRRCSSPLSGGAVRAVVTGATVAASTALATVSQ